jgi:hypothetical protein
MTSSFSQAPMICARGQAPGTGKEMIAVNVRCLDDIDLTALKLRPVDGQKF